MNKMKKLASLVLALVMALALAVPAFASATTTLTLKDGSNAHDYEVYQIFTGDLDGDTLSNVKWGVNGTGTTGQAVDKDTLDALEAAKNLPTDAERIAVITQYVDFSSNPYGNIVNNQTIDVAYGYYLIKDLGEKQPDGSYKVTEGETNSQYVINVVGPFTITPKTSTTTVAKKIQTANGLVDLNEAAIGETVNYEITGTLPERYDDFTKGFFYEFVDTLFKGLTLDESTIKITVDGDASRDITNNFSKVVKTDNDGNTVTTLTCSNLKDVAGLTKDSKIILTYSATVNENAKVGITGNENKVQINYSGDPNDTNPRGETPESKVESYLTELTITKTDENGDVLTGAGFTLTGSGSKAMLVTKTDFQEAADGTYYKLKDGTYTETAPTDETAESYDSTTTVYKKVTVNETQTVTQDTGITAMVDENGKLTFKGLVAGDYKLSESTTPAGYNSIADITFSVVFDPVNKTYSVTNVNGGNIDVTDNVLGITIVNQSGTTLPSTGGIGTTIFYIVGGVLVAGAVVLLITKRRMNIDKD